MNPDNEIVVAQIIASNDKSDSIALDFNDDDDLIPLNADDEERIPSETMLTFDTTKLNDLQSFVDQIRAIEVNEGEMFWKVIGNLPLVNGAIGKKQVKTRLYKYLNKKELLPESLKIVKTFHDHHSSFQ